MSVTKIGIVNVNNLSEDELFTVIAKFLISVDKGYFVFGNNEPLWHEDTPGGSFTYFPKTLCLRINYNLNIRNKRDIRFNLNAKIYDIVKSIEGYDIGDIFNSKHQHLMKTRKKVISFQDPLININYDIEIDSKSDEKNTSSFHPDDCLLKIIDLSDLVLPAGIYKTKLGEFSIDEYISEVLDNPNSGRVIKK